VIITLIGHWGEKRLLADHLQGQRSTKSPWAGLANLVLINFIFLSFLPAIILEVFQPMIPFLGARAGLALGIVVLFFGIVPARLFDAPRQGWNHAFWMILVDFVRVAGALTMVGWLLTL